MTPVTITYRKPGVRPPVFLAGSFTDPAWVLREMRWESDIDGEGLFVAEVEVESDKDYQYKFKIGHGNDWDLDNRCSTTSDNMGNKNNLLPRQPESHSNNNRDYRSPSAMNPKSAPARPVLSRGSSLTDMETSPDTFHKQTNDLNGPARSSRPEHAPVLETLAQDPEPSGQMTDVKTPATPLFAHESFGAYDFGVVDEIPGNVMIMTPINSRQSIASSGAFAPDGTAVDIDDPTLERFPSDRSSVVDTLRRISTGTGEEPVYLNDLPASPQFASRRASVDSTTDSVSSSDALSPTTSLSKRDSRLSHSSLGRTKSTISLQSIVEESPGAPVGSESTGLNDPQRQGAVQGRDGDDDGLEQQDGKVISGHHIRESKPTQALGSHRGKQSEQAVSMHAHPPSKSGDDIAGDLYLRSTENRWFVTGGLLLLGSLFMTWWKNHGS